MIEGTKVQLYSSVSKRMTMYEKGVMNEQLWEIIYSQTMSFTLRKLLVVLRDAEDEPDELLIWVKISR